MIPPKRILSAINDYWPLLEVLVKRFNLSDFSFLDVQTIIKQQQPHLSSDKVFKEVNKLLQLEIIIPLAKSSQLEINRAIADFCQHLLQEENLGAMGEISALVDDLTRVGQRMYNAGLSDDQYELARNARIMDDRVRKIVKLFLHNQNAIFNLVEQAKSNDTHMSLAKRYKAVIEAFDEYIEPMLTMVDIGGHFKTCFAQIEHQISELIEYIMATGKFNQEKRMLEQLRTRILDMYLTGQKSLTKSADILLPLREELRRNTQLTRQAANVLSRIRKQGVNAVLGEFVPAFQSEPQKMSLGNANQMVAYMAELNEFEQAEYTLPNPDEIDRYALPHVPDYDKVKHCFFKQSETTPRSLFAFLEDEYSGLEADELLYLYQKLASDPAINIEQAEQPMTLAHHQHQFILHPYHGAINSNEQP